MRETEGPWEYGYGYAADDMPPLFTTATDPTGATAHPKEERTTSIVDTAGTQSALGPSTGTVGPGAVPEASSTGASCGSLTRGMTVRDTYGDAVAF